MINSNQASELATLLTKQKAHTDELLALMPIERETCLKKSADDIADITAKKETLLKQIAELDKSRQALFQQAGLKDEKGAMEKFIAMTDASQQARLNEAWQALKTNLENCQRENIQSGIVINACQMNTRGLINVLQGRPAQESVTGYDRKGKGQSSGGGYGGGSARA